MSKYLRLNVSTGENNEEDGHHANKPNMLGWQIKVRIATQ